MVSLVSTSAAAAAAAAAAAIAAAAAAAIAAIAAAAFPVATFLATATSPATIAAATSPATIAAATSPATIAAATSPAPTPAASPHPFYCGTARCTWCTGSPVSSADLLGEQLLTEVKARSKRTDFSARASR